MLAVKFHDGTVADNTFKRLADNWDTDTWKTEHFFKNNVSWASTIAAMEANDRDRKQMAEANLQTPEGAKYVAAVEQQLAPYMQQCAQATRWPIAYCKSSDKSLQTTKNHFHARLDRRTGSSSNWIRLSLWWRRNRKKTIRDVRE